MRIQMLYLKMLVLSTLLFSSITVADNGSISYEVMDHEEESAKERIMDWQDLIEHNQGLDEQSKLKLVNDFFNETPYYTDDEIWGKVDYWATPVEMLSINAADCEDYAIAKYFTLREMGVPIEKLRITSVLSLELGQVHIVLTYYEHPNAEPFVLDNLVGRIKVVSQRQDLALVYSFNGDGLWLVNSLGRGKLVDDPSRIGPWQNLVAKMAGESE
ncbi:transglutaminase-like cysteine peptidase [Patescibacteria group bacterium]